GGGRSCVRVPCVSSRHARRGCGGPAHCCRPRSRSCIPTLSSQRSFGTSIASLGGAGLKSSRSPSRFATVGGATASRGSLPGCGSPERPHRRPVDRPVKPDHHVPDCLARLGPVKARRCAPPPQGGAGGLDRALGRATEGHL